MVPAATRGTPEFAMLLRRGRTCAGLTQRELARRSGVSVAAIRDLEQGRSHRPRPGSVSALADALGLPPDEARRLHGAAVGATAEPPRPPDPPDADRTVRVAVLGPLAVHAGPVPLPLGAGRHRTVLARLALTPNATVHRDELVDLLWGSRVPSSAVNLVQTYVSRLRRVLEPVRGRRAPSGLLVHVAGGYRLTVGRDQVDLLRFRDLVARAASGEPPRRLALLDEAVSLWRGDTDVPELRGGPLLTALWEEHVTAVIRHAELARELSQVDRVLPRLRELAGRHRLHEPLRVQLIVALAAAGRQAEALATYEDIRRELADELGIDPSPHLVDARHGVLQQRWLRPVPGHDADRCPACRADAAS